VEHERNGLIVPLRDVDALAEALIRLLRDHDRRRAMGDAGRRMAREQFDERLVFQRVLAAYHRLLNEKGVQVSESAVTGKA
jgi:glycosyltransferase involved in cell wall biosynthesis